MYLLDGLRWSGSHISVGPCDLKRKNVLVGSVRTGSSALEDVWLWDQRLVYSVYVDYKKGIEVLLHTWTWWSTEDIPSCYSMKSEHRLKVSLFPSLCHPVPFIHSYRKEQPSRSRLCVWVIWFDSHLSHRQLLQTTVAYPVCVLRAHVSSWQYALHNPNRGQMEVRTGLPTPDWNV